MEGDKYIVENKNNTTKKRNQHLNQPQQSFITGLNRVNQPRK